MASIILALGGVLATLAAYANLRLTVGQDVQLWCYDRAPDGLAREDGSYNTEYRLNFVPFGVSCIYTKPADLPTEFHDMGTGLVVGGLSALAVGVGSGTIGAVVNRKRQV